MVNAKNTKGKAAAVATTAAPQSLEANSARAGRATKRAQHIEDSQISALQRAVSAQKKIDENRHRQPAATGSMGASEQGRQLPADDVQSLKEQNEDLQARLAALERKVRGKENQDPNERDDMDEVCSRHASSYRPNQGNGQSPKPRIPLRDQFTVSEVKSNHWRQPIHEEVRAEVAPMEAQEAVMQNPVFSAQLQMTTWPERFEMPKVKPPFDGSQDPGLFLHGFELAMMPLRPDGRLLANCLPMVLTGGAQQWFVRLPEGSIQSWAQLKTTFLNSFRHNKAQTPDITRLFHRSMMQQDKESLKQYFRRFCSAVNETPGVSADLQVQAFKSGLSNGPLKGKLFRKGRAIETVDSLYNIIEKYIDEEESCGREPRVEDKELKEKLAEPPQKRKADRNEAADRQGRPPNRYRQDRFNRFRDQDIAPRAQGRRNDYRRDYEEEYFTPLNTSRADILMQIESNPPPGWKKPYKVSVGGNKERFCHYHGGVGHSTEDCRQLKHLIEELIKNGQGNKFVKRQSDKVLPPPPPPAENLPQFPEVHGTLDRAQGVSYVEAARGWEINTVAGCSSSPIRLGSEEEDCQADPSSASANTDEGIELILQDLEDLNLSMENPRGQVYMIDGGNSMGDSRSARKRAEREVMGVYQKFNLHSQMPDITFRSSDFGNVRGPHDDPIILEAIIRNIRVNNLLLDTGAAVNILFRNVIHHLGMEGHEFQYVRTPLKGLSGNPVRVIGKVELPMTLGNKEGFMTLDTEFMVVDTQIPPYSGILARKTMNSFGMIIHPRALLVKFPSPFGILTVRGNQMGGHPSNQYVQKSGEDQSHISKRMTYESAGKSVEHRF